MATAIRGATPIVATGFILNPRLDAIWFLALPYVAIAFALFSYENLSGSAVVSIALLITVPHHFATWLRAYGFNDERHRWSTRLWIGPIFILAMTLIGLSIAPLTLFLLFTLWDKQHSLMQQYGFSRIYDLKGGTGSPLTERFDLGLNWILFVNLLLTAPLWTSYWLRELYRWSVPITPGALTAIQTVSWSVTGLFLAAYLAQVVWSTTRGHRVNPIKYAFLASSYFLWYFTSWYTDSVLFYSIAHRLMHGLQYEVMVYYYIRRKAERFELPRESLMQRVARPGNVKLFIVLGLFYAVAYQFITGHGMQSFGFGLAQFDLPFDSARKLGIPKLTTRQGYDLIATSLIYGIAISHFYVDSFIWKVRDREVRTAL